MLVILHCRENGDEYWFIYLTNWSFFCLNVSLLVHATITITEFIKVKSQGNHEALLGLGLLKAENP